MNRSLYTNVTLTMNRGDRMNSLYDESPFLEHHGIKGQKWGVRRFQNPDGTLTAAGKRRYWGTTVGKRASSNRPSKDYETRAMAYRQRNILDPFFNSYEKQKIKLKPQFKLSSDEDTVIKKGSTVQHITGKDAEQFKSSLTNIENLFVTYDSYDKALYRGVFAASKILHNKGSNSVNQIDVVLKNDLKAPSHTKQVEIFTDIYYKHEDTIARSFAKLFKGGEGKSEDEWYETIKKDFTKSTIQKELYDGFIRGVSYSFNKDFHKNMKEVYADYYRTLKEKGYNSLLDDNDTRLSYMMASKPLIILDILNTVGNFTLKELSPDDIYDNLKYLKSQEKGV